MFWHTAWLQALSILGPGVLQRSIFIRGVCRSDNGRNLSSRSQRCWTAHRPPHLAEAVPWVCAYRSHRRRDRRQIAFSLRPSCTSRRIPPDFELGIRRLNSSEWLLVCCPLSGPGADCHTARYCCCHTVSVNMRAIRAAHWCNDAGCRGPLHTSLNGQPRRPPTQHAKFSFRRSL